MIGKSVSKNTAFLTSSYVLQKILSFVYFVLVARLIGITDLGKYTFALSFTTLFAVFVDFGLTNALIREGAKEAGNLAKYLRPILSVKALLAVIVYGVVILTAYLLDYPALTINLILLSGIIMVLDSFTLTFWGVLRAQRNLKYESISVVINQTIILLSGTLVLFMRLPIIYLMVPFLLASTFSLLFAIWCLRKNQLWNWQTAFSKTAFWQIATISLPFALISIFSRIYGYIDTVMLSKMQGDASVALYSVAMKVPFALQFIPSALSAAIFPAFSYQYGSDLNQLKLTFERAVKFLMVLALPISLGVAVLAKPIMQLVYGAKYLSSSTPLAILMLGLFFIFLNFPLGALLNGCNKQVTNTVFVGSAMVLNIILNLFLIPVYGYVGAGVAFLLCHCLLFIASLIVAYQLLKFNAPKMFWTFAKILVSALIMAFCLWQWRQSLPVIILIILGAIIYGLSLILLGAIEKDEMLFLKNKILKRNSSI